MVKEEAKSSGMMAKVGVWAFIIGLVLAIIISLFYSMSPPSWSIYVLIILGIIVGFLNVTDKEVQMFLVATIGFMIGFQSIGNVVVRISASAGTFFQLVTVFIAPAAVVVAVKALYNITHD